MSQNVTSSLGLFINIPKHFARVSIYSNDKKRKEKTLGRVSSAGLLGYMTEGKGNVPALYKELFSFSIVE